MPNELVTNLVMGTPFRGDACEKCGDDAAVRVPASVTFGMSVVGPLLNLVIDCVHLREEFSNRGDQISATCDEVHRMICMQLETASLFCETEQDYVKFLADWDADA